MGDLTPHDMAENDEAAAEHMRDVQAVDVAIAKGFDQMADMLDRMGFDEAAENTEDSAELAHKLAGNAKYAAETYDNAAKAWTEVEHDLSEQAKLTGEMYAAGATASGAHQTLTGAHQLTEEQRTELAVLAAKEDAASHVYQDRAAAMGKEAFDDTQHAQALEASARLTDPDSGLSNP